MMPLFLTELDCLVAVPNVLFSTDTAERCASLSQGRDGRLGFVLCLVRYPPQQKGWRGRTFITASESGHLGFPLNFAHVFVLGTAGFSVVFGRSRVVII